MLEVTVLLLSIHTVFSEYTHRSIKSCRIGDAVQNECNECLCTPETYFECKPVDCNKSRGLEELSVDSKQFCTPNQLYIQNLITCICNKDGTWPHQSCLQTFLSLPQTRVKKRTCEPNTYVKIDCNVCKCGPDGQVITDRCTKNTCEDDARRADMDAAPQKSNVYSNCILKNWYSLAPCQFCYCVNENKLVCNTGHHFSKKLDVEQYNLEICGMDMIKEAMELIPEESKQLREGIDEDSNRITTAKPETTTIRALADRTTNAALNKDKKHNNKDKASDEDGSDDTSDSDEDQDSTDSKESKKPVEPPIDIVRTGGDNLKSKAQSDEDYDTESNSQEDDSIGDYTRDDDSKGDKSNEMTLDINRALSSKDNAINSYDKPNKSTDQKKSVTKKPIDDLEFADNTLKINVPSVLHKVFEMALRKSMVAISNATKCTPGATYMAKCNMCFCLKNGKELCTANKC